MKYRTDKHIIIDERKLETLIRLGCDKNTIFDAICGNNLKKTGDKLLDEILESLASKKIYTNWGGARRNAGRKPNQLENQVENQVENQLENQVEPQLGTITITNTSCCSYSRKKASNLQTTRDAKKQYGEFQKVKLTDDEYQKLTALYGTRLDAAIDRLDNYLAQKKKDPYASHYAVMKRNGWVYNEVFDDKTEPTGPKIIGGANA